MTGFTNRSRIEGCLAKCFPRQCSTVAQSIPLALEKSISAATEALLGYRQSDGHWVFELEADSTIPSEYVLLRHYLAEPVDAALEAKIANYLRRTQGAHGGWPLVQDGAVRHERQRQILFRAEDDRRFRRCAAYGAGARGDPHRAAAPPTQRLHPVPAGDLRRADLARVPVLPVEIMLLPMWSPFHLNKISYWARTTIVPLMVLAALKPRAKNPKGIGIDELFLQDPQSVGMTAEGAAPKLGLVHAVPRARQDLARDRTAVSEEAAPARDRCARLLSSKSG